MPSYLSQLLHAERTMAELHKELLRLGYKHDGMDGYTLVETPQRSADGGGAGGNPAQPVRTLAEAVLGPSENWGQRCALCALLTPVCKREDCPRK